MVSFFRLFMKTTSTFAYYYQVLHTRKCVILPKLLLRNANNVQSAICCAQSTDVTMFNVLALTCLDSSAQRRLHYATARKAVEKVKEREKERESLPLNL